MLADFMEEVREEKAERKTRGTKPLCYIKNMKKKTDEKRTNKKRVIESEKENKNKKKRHDGMKNKQKERRLSSEIVECKKPRKIYYHQCPIWSLI